MVFVVSGAQLAGGAGGGVTATFDGHDLNTSPYRLLADGVAFLSAPDQRLVLQSYGGAIASSVLASRADDSRTLPVAIGIDGTDTADLEANIAQLKLWLRPARRRLVLSGTDGRFWIATCTAMQVAYTAPTYAQAACTFTIERPYQEEAAVRGVVSTATLGATFDTTPAGQGVNAYANVVLTAAPVVYWRLGELAGAAYVNDAGPRGISGVCQGSSLPVFGAAGAIVGDTDTAVTLASANSQSITGTSSAFDVADTFSFEIWFKRATTGQQTLISCLLSSTNLDGFEVRIDVSGNIVLLQRASAGDNQICKSTATVTDTTTWHHLVVIKDGSSSTKIYLDNADVTGAVTDHTIIAGMDRLWIGVHATNATSTAYWNGSLDEFALYPTALTATQVSNHYQVGTGATFTRYAVSLNAVLAADGNAATPVRGLLSLVIFSATGSRFVLTNTTPGRTRPPQRLITTGTFPQLHALLLDPRRGQVTKLNLNLGASIVTGWWPFCDAGGGPLDFSGQLHDLTAHGTLSYQQDGPDDGPGAAGGDRPAILFDGATGYLSSNSTGFDVGAGDFTVGAWVRTSEAPGTLRAIIGKAETNKGWVLDRDAAGRLNFGYGLGASAASVSGTTVLVADTWWFVTMTHTAATGTIRLYVNGVLEFQTTHAGTIAASANDLRIGGANWLGDGLPRWWPGSVAEPFILTIALTPAQVYDVYQYGSLIYYAGVPQEWYEQFPELDPALAATNTLELATYAIGTQPGVRQAYSWRTRYA